MKVLVIEDEKQAAARLVSLLQESHHGIEIINTLDTVAASVAYLKLAPPPDLIFMDIQLGDGKSFDIFRQVHITSHVVFTTAFDEYALQAFKYNSIDYLLKPIKRAELEAAINKYQNYFHPTPANLDMSYFLSQLQAAVKEYKARFLVKKGSRFLSIAVEDVAYAYTKDRVHLIKTFKDEDYLIDCNLEELESQLNPADFFKVNRQFIIHFKAIDKAIAWFDGKLKLTVQPPAHEEIIISRLRAAEFKKWMGR